MTFDELLSKVLEILPDATIEDGPTGELVVFTGLRMADPDVSGQDMADTVVKMNEE